MSEGRVKGDLVCAEVVEKISDYLERALDEEARAHLEQHLLLCEACAAYFDQVKTTVRLASALAAAPAPRPELGPLFEALRKATSKGAP